MHLNEISKKGNCPQVSWINAPSIYCGTPDHRVQYKVHGLFQEILDALTAVPEVWSKTVFLINFDENDGYFDHMPSPSAPSLLSDKTYAGKSTLSHTDMQYEYFSHDAPLGSKSQPAKDNNVYATQVHVYPYL